MNSESTTPHTPADDQLIDAALHEHARLGTGADEFLLAKIHNAITTMQQPTPSARRPFRFAWLSGIAAALMLATGLLWTLIPGGKEPLHTTTTDTKASGIFLTTDLPPELIEGTPVPIHVPRLLGVPAEAPTIQVPEGTVLLSRGKPVTSSDAFPLIGTLDLVTDGEKDAGEGYYVELEEGLQWIQIDLEKPAEIHAIWVWHFHSQRRAYHDVVIQISDDPEFKQGVTTIFNNDFDNSSGLGRGNDHPYIESRFGLLVDGRGSPGRYIRLYSNGNTSDDTNHYIEVEVFGISKP
ncbi:MAG: hypothetical protein ACNA8L_11345 [Luteolibacter sp.]